MHARPVVALAFLCSVSMLPASADTTVTFRAAPVTPAISVGAALDLYEPSVSVSSHGDIYVAAHSAGVFTTRAPAWVSHDDGLTWQNLPGFATLPAEVHGSGMLDGDEGIVVSDTTGRSWMLDNGAGSMSVTGWCNNGTVQCHYNPSVWDQAGAARHRCGLPVDDRPWLAYGKDKLLLVNNANGEAQIAVYDANQALPVGAGGPTWNYCAGSGWIPGPPSVRADGVYAGPQTQGSGPTYRLSIITGSVDDDPANATTVTATPLENHGLSCGGNFGFSSFDGSGTLWAGAASLDTNAQAPSIALASSPDVSTFQTSSFDPGGGVSFMWITGNPNGPGALLMYAVGSCSSSSFYAAHLSVGANGPVVSDVSLVAADVPNAIGDYISAGVGPDGRAYLVTYAADDFLLTTGVRPLTVYVQSGGPTF